MIEDKDGPESDRVREGEGSQEEVSPQEGREERERTFTRRGLLKSAWVIPVILAVPSVASAMSHTDLHLDYHSDTHIDNHADTPAPSVRETTDPGKKDPGPTHADHHADHHADQHGDSGGGGRTK